MSIHSHGRGRAGPGAHPLMRLATIPPRIVSVRIARIGLMSIGPERRDEAAEDREVGIRHLGDEAGDRADA